MGSYTDLSSVLISIHHGSRGHHGDHLDPPGRIFQPLPMGWRRTRQFRCGLQQSWVDISLHFPWTSTGKAAEARSALNRA